MPCKTGICFLIKWVDLFLYHQKPLKRWVSCRIYHFGMHCLKIICPLYRFNFIYSMQLLLVFVVDCLMFFSCPSEMAKFSMLIFTIIHALFKFNLSSWISCYHVMMSLSHTHHTFTYVCQYYNCVGWITWEILYFTQAILIMGPVLQ